MLALAIGSPKAQDAPEIYVPVACSSPDHAKRFNQLQDQAGIVADPTIPDWPYLQAVRLRKEVNKEAHDSVCRELRAKVDDINVESEEDGPSGAARYTVYKVKVVSIFRELTGMWIDGEKFLYIPVRWKGKTL
jgi:hypothetical protein